MSLNILEIAGHIADLKDTSYKNTLAVAVTIELLIDKGIFTREEFAGKARELEQATLADIIASRRAKAVATNPLAAMPPFSPERSEEHHLQA